MRPRIVAFEEHCYEFLDAQASLVPINVLPSVRTSHFQISILSASLVALRGKLKKVDPNDFSILSLGVMWEKSQNGGLRILRAFASLFLNWRDFFTLKENALWPNYCASEWPDAYN